MEIYGVSSKIPPFFTRNFCVNYHWILVDVDSDDLTCWVETYRYLVKKYPDAPIQSFKTPHGFHLICYQKLSFAMASRVLSAIPNIDANWFRIGKKRGYWFLWTRKPIKPVYPVTFMRLKIWEGCEWLATKNTI
jgi:hypothetical protein